MAGAPAYALDTEFHRERTYYPKVALVQLAVDDLIALGRSARRRHRAARRAPRQRCDGGPACVTARPRGAVAWLQHGAPEAVRHAARRRLRGLQLARAHQPPVVRALDPPAEGRPPDRLARPAALGRAARVRRVGRGPPARAPREARRQARGGRSARVGPRRVRGAADAPGRPARPEPSVAAHQRSPSPPRGEPRRRPGGRRVA